MTDLFPALADWLADRSALLATKHQKEKVIAPLFAAELGLSVVVPSDLEIEFDTDRFGSFSREVPRVGSQLEAACRKVAAALDATGHTLGLASEGSFGPHPAMPFLPCNRELVVLIDRQQTLQIVGEVLSTQTNYRQTQVSTWEAAQQFAQQIGFPAHGLVVIAGAGSVSEGISADQIRKGITSAAEFASAFAWAKTQAEKVWLETDMRALYNPTRMQVIQQATQDLIAKLKSTCPRCRTPGFAIVDRESGLPCGLCGQPTSLIRSVIHGCDRCGFQQTVLFPEGSKTADPTYCHYCNP